MLIYGHRGAAGLVLENTIESIRTALELGVDGVEIDVRSSRDGIPVVIHDATLDRTTNGHGPVHDQTLAELRGLVVGQTARIPTLQEVFSVIGTSCGLNIELKEAGAAAATARLIREALQENVVSREQVVVSSFQLEALHLVRQVEGIICVALLTKGLPTDGFWRSAKLLGAVAAHIDLASVTGAFVEQAHKESLRVMVYAVNRPEDAVRMNDLGVDGIFSAFPDRVWPCHNRRPPDVSAQPLVPHGT